MFPYGFHELRHWEEYIASMNLAVVSSQGERRGRDMSWGNLRRELMEEFPIITISPAGRTCGTQ